MARTPAHMADQLRALANPKVKRRIGAALFVAGNAVQVDAQISITTGAVSGKGHVPSSPGAAPNTDTHFLANNIETPLIRDTGSELKVEVTSNAPYSVALELALHVSPLARSCSRRPRRTAGQPRSLFAAQ
jgi:hypothetical protein